jgi:hypothetical protein
MSSAEDSLEGTSALFSHHIIDYARISQHEYGLIVLFECYFLINVTGYRKIEQGLALQSEYSFPIRAVLSALFHLLGAKKLDNVQPICKLQLLQILVFLP